MRRGGGGELRVERVRVVFMRGEREDRREEGIERGVVRVGRWRKRRRGMMYILLDIAGR